VVQSNPEGQRERTPKGWSVQNGRGPPRRGQGPSWNRHDPVSHHLDPGRPPPGRRTGRKTL